MLKKVAFLVYTFFTLNEVQSKTIEKPMLIVVPSYNNAQWCKINLDSILNQNYSNYRIIYINDASYDRTREYVEEIVKQKTNDHQFLFFDVVYDEDILGAAKAFNSLVNKEKRFFTLVNNQHRRGCLLANLYPAVYSVQDEEIIVTLDGDDCLAHENVLKEVNEHYSLGEIWLTHGKFIEYPRNTSNWSLRIPDKVINQNSFRKFRLPSHLRTFYAWLFKKIKLEDLLYNGKFFPMTGDMAMMFPMIEMAAERHAFIDKVNCVYNPINDNKVNVKLQNDLDAYIINLPPYNRLKN